MTRPTPPPPTADTAYEHLSADGFLLFDEPNGTYTIWRINQATSDEEKP